MKIKFKDLQTGEAVFERELLPSQELFWEAVERVVLFSGGIGCGKSMIMLMRVIFECMSQDNNYFLVGRTTYQEIHDVLIKEFMEICHPSWIKEYRKTPHPTVILHTFTGKSSEIIFRNLDGLSQGELLGLNLGGVAIDQAEDIPKEIFLTLIGRLRRGGIKHRVFMTSNPKLSWLYGDFKERPVEGYRLIEGSTLENEKNLPVEYINDLKKYPPSWRKQYVEGVWDESLLSDNIVFAREYVERMGKFIRPPIRDYEGLKIYRDYIEGHTYQIGIDSAEGADTTESSMRETPKDNGVIVIWDKTADEEAATFAARVPPRVLAEKAVHFAALYRNPEIIPEMNSMGVALIDKLDDLGYQNIYRRKEFDRVLKKSMRKVGWRTTASTKQLLIAHFEELLRKREPKIFSRETVQEFKSFVYTDNAKKKGAGARDGAHDDRVMATLLAAFDEEPVSTASVKAQKSGIIIPNGELTPSVTLVRGKYRPPAMPGDQAREGRASWTTL